MCSNIADCICSKDWTEVFGLSPRFCQMFYFCQYLMNIVWLAFLKTNKDVRKTFVFVYVRFFILMIWNMDELIYEIKCCLFVCCMLFSILPVPLVTRPVHVSMMGYNLIYMLIMYRNILIWRYSTMMAVTSTKIWSMPNLLSVIRLDTLYWYICIKFSY